MHVRIDRSENTTASFAGAQQSIGAVGSFVARPDASGADELPAELSAFLARDLQRCTSPLGDSAHDRKMFFHVEVLACCLSSSRWKADVLSTG